MVTYVLAKVSEYLWSISCDAQINTLDVMYGNTRALVTSDGSASSWRFLSCVDFNTVTFGS